jgi:hypothetical protein
MAGQDYVPDFLPAHQLTCTAGAPITQGQLVYVSGNTWPNPTVSPTTAATSARVGVAAATVASGALVNVYFAGVHQLAASGSITAGDPVVAAAAGAVADGSAVSTVAGALTIVGNAVTTAASSLVHVLLNS